MILIALVALILFVAYRMMIRERHNLFVQCHCCGKMQPYETSVFCWEYGYFCNPVEADWFRYHGVER